MGSSMYPGAERSHRVCTAGKNAQFADGHMRWGHADSAEGVATQSGKGAHSTKDGNPCGWLTLGRGARGRGFGGQVTFIGWKRKVY